MKHLLEKANILAEALPYIHRFSNKTIVIKYGGNAMGSEKVRKTILEDIVLLKICGVNPILVHGGGPEINSMLTKLQIESSFHNGLRVTNADTMEVVQMVLCGKLNKDLVSKLCSMDVSAVGVSGKDANLIKVEKIKSDIDLGFVGEVTDINGDFLKLLISGGFIPVVATVGTDKDGNSYNINADTVASEIAIAVGAEKLVFLTDVEGICTVANDVSTLISQISVAEIKSMLDSGSISGGMIPKVNGCIKAVENGITNTHILSGKMEHPIMLELFTDKGIGTMVTK